jgi:uncharacterized coiled-coil protein SlyX
LDRLIPEEGREVTITGAEDIQAYTTWHKVIISGPAGGCTTSPQSTDNFYTKGSDVTITCSTSVPEGDHTRHVLNAPPPKPVTVDTFKEYTPYKTQYLLKVEAPQGRYKVSLSSSDGFYDKGTPVVVESQDSPNWRFKGWSGDCQGIQKKCQVTMSAPTVVKGDFPDVTTQEAVSGLNNTVTQASKDLNQSAKGLADAVGRLVWVFAGMGSVGLLLLGFVVFRRSLGRPRGNGQDKSPVTPNFPQSPIQVSLSSDTLDRLAQRPSGEEKAINVQSEVSLPDQLTDVFKLLLKDKELAQHEAIIGAKTQELQRLTGEVEGLQRLTVSLEGQVGNQRNTLRELDTRVNTTTGNLETAQTHLKRVTDDINQKESSQIASAAAMLEAHKKYEAWQAVARSVQPAEGTARHWSEEEQALRNALVRLNGERPVRLVRFLEAPSSPVALQTIKGATRHKVFTNKDQLVLPIPDAVNCDFLILGLIARGIDGANSNSVVEDGLELDQAQENRNRSLSSRLYNLWRYEAERPPVFMAPFWYYSLRNAYEAICKSKHDRFARDFPSQPKLDYTFEEGFRLLMDEYFEPFADSLETNNTPYHLARNRYPTNQSWLGEELENDMRRLTEQVVLRQLDISHIHQSLSRLVGSLQDPGMANFTGLNSLLADWDRAPDEGARRRWATVCAALVPYFQRFLLRR